MGDPMTSRPSLRKEIKEDLDHINEKVDVMKGKIDGLPVLKWLVTAVGLAVIAGAIANFVNNSGG